jgi:hypothetical protein
MRKDAQEPQCSVEPHAIRTSPGRRQYLFGWALLSGCSESEPAVWKAWGNYGVARRGRPRQGLSLGVRRLSPEQSDPELSAPWVPADVLLREEPENEEEDEDEHEGGGEDDDEDGDEGYSE